MSEKAQLHYDVSLAFAAQAIVSSYKREPTLWERGRICAFRELFATEEERKDLAQAIRAYREYKRETGRAAA